MTRKFGDDLHRSPGTMGSGHISSLPTGSSAVGIPDLKRLGEQPGFYAVPSRKEMEAYHAAKREQAAAKDHLTKGDNSSQSRSEKHETHAKTAHKGPVERALQMLKPHKTMKKDGPSK